MKRRQAEKIVVMALDGRCLRWNGRTVERVKQWYRGRLERCSVRFRRVAERAWGKLG